MFFVYENVELNGILYDVRAEQFSTRVVVTDVFENNSDIEVSLSDDDVRKLGKILNFELGYI